MNIPQSLTDPGLAGFWESLRDRLERNGVEWRGRVQLPHLGPTHKLTIESLVDKHLNKTVELSRIEEGLVNLGVGPDLETALANLGFTVSSVRQDRRAARGIAAAARSAARETALTWGAERDVAWAEDWFDELNRAGLLANMTPDEAIDLVRTAGRVVDALSESDTDPSTEPVSRVDLAARLLGSSHGLDPGTRLERVVTKALAHLVAGDDDRSVWEQAGAHFDLVSGPALTWNLRLVSDHPLSPLSERSTELGVPYLFTQMALRRYPIKVDPKHPVLVVENPRVLERAVQRPSELSIICTNGNPSTTVQLALAHIVAQGVEVRYHGDFDTPGLAICARMQTIGLTPWQMDVASYEQALLAAAAQGVDLPVEESPAGHTPWDPELSEVFNQHRRIVHEERLLDRIITI